MISVLIIGGGAAGCFAACAAAAAGGRVTLYEKTSRLLAKVKVSGGGRCNVTHDCPHVSALIGHYPRGGKALRKAFHAFGPADTVRWFESRGVRLKTEADGRMFPVTDHSQTVIDCLTDEMHRCGVTVHFQREVVRLQPHAPGGLAVTTRAGDTAHFDRVIVTTGGSPKAEGLQWLADLGHEIAPPVPSLFTFNLTDTSLRDLMGLSANPTRMRVASTGLSAEGPALVTHWGLSGPAILRLSAWGARELAASQYRFTCLANWTGTQSEADVRATLQALRTTAGKRLCRNQNPFGLPQRLWAHLLTRAEVPAEATWAQLGSKPFNRLVHTLTHDAYEVAGKTTFKEEFVTCGGVSLRSVDTRTFESKAVPGLFFAGEVLDVDGITGGFNFQAAWTTGHLAGQAAVGTTKAVPQPVS